MDLIFMNAAKEDLGVLQDYELDMAFGADENNFECQIQSASHCCEAGFFLYMEGTEYGGIIDSITSNTESGEVVYSGRTWHGILNSKVLQPDSGQAYLTVNGEANAVIADLLTRLELADMFEASDEDSGLTIKNYQMNRYISGYDGIMKMLSSVGGKLKVSFNGTKVVLSAAEAHDYTQDEEFDSDQVPFTAKRNYASVNHLICLGSGLLEDRMVVHLYVDTDGKISQTQTQFGLDEVCSIYEYSNIETEEALIEEGTNHLKEILATDEISIDFDADSDAYDVGDIVGAVDNITGLTAYATIAKKIVTIKNGVVKVSLSPDSARSGSSMEYGGASGSQFNLEGKEGQLVGFDSNGTAKAIDPPYCNPNLLDNWYFGNPVDQRGGYIVPVGTECFSDSGLKTSVGATSQPYAVNEITSSYVAYHTGVAMRYSAPNVVVRGYIGEGYSIDRWYKAKGESLTLRTGCARIECVATSGRNFHQKVELDKLIVGNVYTASLLVSAVNLQSGTISFRAGITSSIGAIKVTTVPSAGLYSFSFVMPELTEPLTIDCSPSAVGGYVDVVAMKLEPGNQQTLAHQENGAWVLNEIPNYAEELAKCQRYFVPIAKNNWARFRASAYTNDYFVFSVPVPCEMRTRPTIVGADYLRVCNVYGGTRSDGFTCSVDGYGSGYVAVIAGKSAHGLTDAQLAISSADIKNVFFDANL